MDNLEAEFDRCMALARSLLRPEWKYGEAVILKTEKGNVYSIAIPDYQDPAVREPLEEQCIQTLLGFGDTAVVLCIATVNAVHPEIPSWHLRSRLVEIDPGNLQTENFLWGGGDVFYVKPFQRLLPPEKPSQCSL